MNSCDVQQFDEFVGRCWTQNNTQQQKTVHCYCAYAVVCVGRKWLISRVLTELCCIMLDNVDHSVFWGLFLMVLTTTVCSDQTLQHYFNLSVAFPAWQWLNMWKIDGLPARKKSTGFSFQFYPEKICLCSCYLEARDPSWIWSEDLKNYDLQ